MVKINGKEYGLFYSVGARCRAEKFIIDNPKATVTEFKIMQMVYMIEAYGKKNKSEQKVAPEMIFNLPNSELEELLEEAEKQIAADSTKSVEAEPAKGKNAKSAAKSS